MGGGRSHESDRNRRTPKRLIVVLVITCAVLIAEVVGGLIAGSLALLADAGHMLTDSTGLILALIAASLATRAATAKRTFDCSAPRCWRPSAMPCSLGLPFGC